MQSWPGALATGPSWLPSALGRRPSLGGAPGAWSTQASVSHRHGLVPPPPSGFQTVLQSQGDTGSHQPSSLSEAPGRSQQVRHMWVPTGGQPEAARAWQPAAALFRLTLFHFVWLLIFLHSIFSCDLTYTWQGTQTLSIACSPRQPGCSADHAALGQGQGRGLGGPVPLPTCPPGGSRRPHAQMQVKALWRRGWGPSRAPGCQLTPGRGR